MTRIRSVLYAPNGNRIRQLTSVSDLSFSSPMNEIGAAEVNYLPSKPGYTDLLSPVELAIEASVDGLSWIELPNCRYMRLERDYEQIGKNGARKFTFTGYGWQLKKAIQWQTTGLNADGKRPFLSATPGLILKTLIDEAHGRGTIAGLTYNFSATHDSAGQLWDKIITIYYEPGLPLYQILDNLAQQAMCDWRFQGRELQMFNADTAMGVTRDVRLKPGVDIKALPVKASIQDLINRALIIGDNGVTLPLSNPTVGMPWGNWEGSISNSGVSDPTTMTLLGNSLMESGGQEKVQYTAELKMNTTTYHPFIDFLPGEYITMPGESGEYDPFRVRQINGRLGTQNGPQFDLVINDRFVEREIRNAKRTNGIVGGSTAGGSGGRPTVPVEVDNSKPKAPTGLVVLPLSFMDPQGNIVGVARAGWQPVTETVENKPVEEDSVTYQLEMRLNEIDQQWTTVASTAGDTVDVGRLVPGSTYQFQVRAILAPGARAGEASLVETVQIPLNDDPPPAPSDPIVSTRLGTVKIEWDGKNATGGAMPLDIESIQIWRQGTTDRELIGAIGSRVGGSAVIAGLERIPQTIWLTAVDRGGNESAPSTTVVITPVGITGPDIEANSITANEIEVGSLTGEVLSADALNGLTITGATIQTAASGARTVMTADGIEVFDDLNQLLAQIGHGIDTGIALRSPKTGQMVPLSRAMFPNQTVSWAPEWLMPAANWPAIGGYTLRSNQYTIGNQTRWYIGTDSFAPFTIGGTPQLRTAGGSAILVGAAGTITPTANGPVSITAFLELGGQGFGPGENRQYYSTSWLRNSYGDNASPRDPKKVSTVRGDEMWQGWYARVVLTPRTAGYPTVTINSAVALMQLRNNDAIVTQLTGTGNVSASQGIIYDITVYLIPHARVYWDNTPLPANEGFGLGWLKERPASTGYPFGALASTVWSPTSAIYVGGDGFVFPVTLKDWAYSEKVGQDNSTNVNYVTSGVPARGVVRLKRVEVTVYT